MLTEAQTQELQKFRKSQNRWLWFEFIFLSGLHWFWGAPLWFAVPFTMIYMNFQSDRSRRQISSYRAHMEDRYLDAIKEESAA